MATALVGYTGFVGSNIYTVGDFDSVYNTKNIEDAYGTSPDLLIYAGVKAEKYLANSFPEKDRESIIQAEANISKINPKKLVLISTIDVFRVPKNVDETSEIDASNLQTYGYNRLQLETWVRERYHDALIVRLPALFGKNIKKNFIYDYINVIPFMLDKSKYEELCAKKSMLRQYYISKNNGFYELNVLEEDKPKLKKIFIELGFSALYFTDSRSTFQFYNLERLWKDINIALENNIRLWHPATEPVSASELYYSLEGKEFKNERAGVPAYYDYKTIYSDIYGGKDGYICDKDTIIREIKQFVGKY